jgi:hypothetical protein
MIWIVVVGVAVVVAPAGFQSGWAEKSVNVVHTRCGGASISMNVMISCIAGL